MLTAGSTKARGIWLDVIEGRLHPLLHGYFCTRQPDDEDRSHGITAKEARLAEAAFFSENSPWANCSVRNRLGTENLISMLSMLLVQVINER